jgi:hypothetical protein
MARAAILADNTLKIKILDPLSCRDVVACIIETKDRPVLLASIYCDINKADFDHIEKVAEYANANKLRLIIGTDSNAHSTLWGTKQNNRGDTLEHVIARRNLQINNIPGGPPTFRNANGNETHIDLTLSLDFYQGVHGWNVEEFADSDHNLITFIMKLNPEKKQVRNWGRIQWGAVREQCDQRLPKLGARTSMDSITNVVNQLTCTIAETVEELCPLRDANRTKSKSWWNCEDIKPYIARKKKLKSKFNRTKNSNDEQLYKTASNLCKNKIRNYQLESEKKDLEELQSIPDLMKVIKRQSAQPSIEVIKGTPEETVKALLDRHCPDSEPVTPATTNLTSKAIRTEKLDKMYPHINKATVHKALKDFKPQKAPGPDGIIPLVLHNLSEGTVTLLVQVYNYSHKILQVGPC